MKKRDLMNHFLSSMDVIVLISCLSAFQGPRGDRGDKGDPVSFETVHPQKVLRKTKMALMSSLSLRLLMFFRVKSG